MTGNGENAMDLKTPPIANRINKLFDIDRAAGDPEETSAVVAGALGTTLGRSVTGEDLDELRSGRRIRPDDLAVLSRLAEHFGAPVSYLAAQWDSEALQYDGELSLLAQLRDNGVQMLAMRDGGVTNTTELIEILQQLPDQPGKLQT